MMRVTPLRFTTLQCSQIGFTLVRTFTSAPSLSDGQIVQDAQNRHLTMPVQGTGCRRVRGPTRVPEPGPRGPVSSRPRARARRSRSAQEPRSVAPDSRRIGRRHRRGSGRLPSLRRDGRRAPASPADPVLGPDSRHLVAGTDHAVCPGFPGQSAQSADLVRDGIDRLPRRIRVCRGVHGRQHRDRQDSATGAGSLHRRRDHRPAADRVDRDQGGPV